MDLNLCDQKMKGLQSHIKFLSVFIEKLKASSQMQHGQFIHKLEKLYEVANIKSLKPELIIKIENVLKKLKEKYDSKTNIVAVEQECLSFKASDAKSMSENKDRTTSLLEFLTELSDTDVKVKKDKSDKHADNSRNRKQKIRLRSRRSKSRGRDRLRRDRQSRSVSPERSRHGKSERYHYKKSDKLPSPHYRGEQKYDLSENRGNYSSPSKYNRTNYRSANDSKPENKYERSDRDSSVGRRGNKELVVNPFNHRSNTVFNRVDTIVQSNKAKLLDDRMTEFKASELTPRYIKISGCAADEDSTDELEVTSKQVNQMKVKEKTKCNGNKSSTHSEIPTSALRKVSLTSHIPETEVMYDLGLFKQDTTPKKCTSTLVRETVEEDSALLSSVKTFSESTPKYQDASIKPKCSRSIDDDFINKIITEATDMKNDVASLKPKGDSSVLIQPTSATTKIIEEIGKKVVDVPVTRDRQSLNEVTHSSNLQIIRPTDPRLRLREQRQQEQRNSSLFYSKPTAFARSYPPVTQSKPGNPIYKTSQYPRPSAIPNIGNNLSVHHGQPHSYPSNMTFQYAMSSHPNPAGHNLNPTTPMTYGEYRRRNAASEKLKNKIVMDASSTDISMSRLDNVYRSGICTPNKKPHYAAKTHNSNITEADWDDSNEIVLGNSRGVVNSNSEASQIRDPASASSSTEKQNDFVTSSTLLLTGNQSSVISEEMQSAFKQLLNPNMLPTLLKACGQTLDDNMASRLRECIQRWNETNQPGKCTQNPPTEVVQTVTPRTPRKNELTKLHEDIRSMFICDEVLSATGRRMCAMSNNAKNESVAAVNSKTNKHESQLKDDITVPNKRLVPSNGAQKVGRRMSCFADLSKRYTQPSPDPHKEKSAGAAFQKPKKTIEGTKKAIKPTKTIYLSEDTNEIAKQLRPCSIVLKKLPPLASMEILSGIVNPKKYGRRKRQIDETDDTQTVEAVRKKRLSTRTVTVKNNNPAWHCFSNTMDCQLCEESVGISLISHYVNCHPDNEVFPSRVSPEVADFLRNSKEVHKVERVSTVVIERYISYEFKQRCYFCNETKSLTRMGWLHHISVHTGYYQYKCADCKKKFSTPAPFHLCNTVRVRSNLIKDPLSQCTQREVFGYLCDLCNFVRFEKCEIKKHLRCEHEGYDVTTKFKKIILLSFPKKKTKIKSNVVERIETSIETRPRKRSKSVANLDKDEKELQSLKVFRSHVVQSKAFIAEPNENDGLVKCATKKLTKDKSFSTFKDAKCSPISNQKKSVAEKRNEKCNSKQGHYRSKIASNDKKRSESGCLDRLNSDHGATDGINTQREDDNVRETSKEKKSPATTTYIREDNCKSTEEIFVEPNVDFESHSSDETESEIPTSRIIDTTKHSTQQSISSQDSVPQLYSVDKLTEAMPQSEDKVSVNEEKGSEPGRMEGSVFIKCEILPADDQSHMNEAKAVANANQRSIQHSKKLPILTQLTTTVTKPKISTLVTLNAPSLPAGRDDFRVVSLQQWLNIPTLKLQKCCRIMLRDISMFALYKCMDITCAFSTNDTELMLIHLRNHENHAASQINNQLGSPSWLDCPYCNVIGDSCLLLLEHIQHEHQSRIFQCPYCFYRSCASYNVIVHLSQFHQFEQKSILVCHGKLKEYATEKIFIEMSRHEFVRPLRCTEGCEKITFAMDHFVQHMRDSPAHSDKFKCQFCRCYIAISSAAKHLLCHRIGVLECVYCRYGTNGVESIQNHMCNSHPSKLPYICVRLMKSQVLTDEQLRSVESTLSVHLGQSVDPKLFHRCPYTEQQLNFLSPSIGENSILSESEIVLAPAPLKELTSSSLAPIDISSETSTNADTLGPSSSCLMLSGILSYETFKREYVSDDYDKYFAT